MAALARRPGSAVSDALANDAIARARAVLGKGTTSARPDFGARALHDPRDAL
jgi:hypothetical protein